MPNFGPVNGVAVNNAGGVTEFIQDVVGVGVGSPVAGHLFAFNVDDFEHPVEFDVEPITGDVSTWVEFEVTQIYTIEFQDDLEFPVKYDVTGVGDVETPVEYAVFDGSYYFDFSTNNAFRWEPVVNLEVVAGDRPGESGDISEYLTGIVSVEAEESAARIAEFTREPRPIGPCPTETDPEFLDLTKHIGRTITIDYRLKDALGATLTTQRIFTGVVNEPTYDPVTRMTTYTCTDNRQVILENMDRANIDSLMPGAYYSDFVFDPDADNFTYTGDRLSTVPYTLDLDRFGAWQFTPFAAEISPIYSFDESNTVYESVGVGIEPYRNVTSEVEIEFNYRYLRLRERRMGFSWEYPGDFCDYLNSGHTIPKKQMIVSAANGGSWNLVDVIFWNMPSSQAFQCQPGAGPQNWVNSGAGNAPLFTMEVSGTISKRFRNNVNENYVLTIRAPEAQTQFGSVKDTMSVSVSSEFDLENWANEALFVKEAFIERNPLIATTQQAVNDTDFGYPYLLNGTDRYYDAIGDEVIDGEGRRIDMNNAMNTAIQVAKVKLLDSHRQNTVTWQSVLIPEIELYYTIQVDTCPVHAKGKVKHFRHEMDIVSGQATTDITISVSKTIDGAVTETATAPAPIPDTVSGMGSGSTTVVLDTRYGGQNINNLFDFSWPPDPSPAIDDEPFNGYSGNRSPADIGSQFYPVQFQIITEVIDEADNEDIEAEQLATYDVNIPDELLELQA